MNGHHAICFKQTLSVTFLKLPFQFHNYFNFIIIQSSEKVSLQNALKGYNQLHFVLEEKNTKIQTQTDRESEFTTIS